MKAEIIAIGTEMLLGSLVDTNSAAIGRSLADLGVDLARKSVVGDNSSRLEDELKLALARADAVITTGGLGPTVDDVTRPALAKVSGCPLREDSALAARLKDFFAARGRPMPPSNLSQAQVPDGAEILDNPLGTAPGLLIHCHGEFEGKTLWAMPGPPLEMVPMLEKQVLPRLNRMLGQHGTILTQKLFTFGLSESAADHAIRDLFEASRNPSLAMLAHGTHVEIRITAKAASVLDAMNLITPLKMKILERIGACVFSQDGENLETVVGRMLKQRKARVALAESCTGGRVAARITSVPGSSEYFDLGLVTYSDAVKQKLLGVPESLLKTHGAVSRECAGSMASGLAKAHGREYSLAITGIAGPDGGSGEKPVGLVHFALAHSGDIWHQEYRFGPGERGIIQSRASQAGLFLLYCALKGRHPPEQGNDRGALS